MENNRFDSEKEAEQFRMTKTREQYLVFVERAFVRCSGWEWVEINFFASFHAAAIRFTSSCLRSVDLKKEKCLPHYDEVMLCSKAGK